VTAEHLDHLLHELVHELHGLHLGERAHALGHSLHDCVASLEGTLAHALSCGGGGAGAGAGGAQLLHRVAGNLQSVSSSLAGNLHSLGGQLQHGLHVAEHAVGRGLHAVEASIHTKAAHLQGALAQQLRPIVQWPTPRWPVRRAVARGRAAERVGAGRVCGRSSGRPWRYSSDRRCSTTPCAWRSS
jgi:hypothetical protein